MANAGRRESEDATNARWPGTNVMDGVGWWAVADARGGRGEDGVNVEMEMVMIRWTRVSALISAGDRGSIRFHVSPSSY